MFVNLFLIALFLVVTGTGFFQGTVKLLIALVTFYVSVVLASLYFKFLATYFKNTSAIVAESVSFFLILALCFAILLAMALYTFRYVRFPGRLEYVDRILGVVLGVVFGALVACVVAMILQYAFISHSAGNEYPITRALQRSTRGSQLVQILIYNILPRLFTAVSPFLPDAALPFFNPTRS